MVRKVINIQSGSIEDKEVLVKQTTSYKIKGFNNKGISNFKLSKQLVYDEVIYYDIETVKIGVDYNLLEKKDTLDLSKNIIYSFSVLIPKNKIFDKGIKIILDRYINIIDLENNEILDISEHDNFYSFYYANDNNTFKVLEYLAEIFLFLSKDTKQKVENITSKSSLKIIGFNNNKFDDLIFKHLENSNIFQDSINKINKLELHYIKNKVVHNQIATKHILNIMSYDSKDLSKNFGAFNLASLGEQMKLSKLDIVNNEDTSKIDKIKTNILYNNRDNEIVYYFIKFINEDMGIYQTNVAGWTRRYFYSQIFEKLQVDSINVDRNINKFKLYGGRTEAYKHLVTNKEVDIKYVDYNSLYTSAAVCLDMSIGQKREYKDKLEYDFKLKSVVINSEFNSLILSTQSYLLNNNNFSYIDLHNNYNSDNFYIGKFKIKGMNPLFEDKAELFNFYFPFVSSIQGKSSFSFDSDIIYEIGFYEILFLAIFDFEIVEIYSINKGQDILKEEKIKIYEDRKILKSQNNKLEKLEKLKLNSGYGIFATKNIINQTILDNKQIETLDRISNNIENKDKKDIWKMLQDNNYIFQNGKDYFNVKNIGSNYSSVKEVSGQKWTGNSIPIIGLNIVSNARFMMYAIYLDYILNVASNDLQEQEIYYTDTDSLFCSNALYERLGHQGLVGNELGQLKDEYPDDTIEYIKAFAPKTYEYKLKNENAIKRVFKGTGKKINRVIINQSIKQNFNQINRVALNPNTIQKRTLENNLFMNRFDVSKELIIKWDEFVNEDNIK